MNYSKNQYEQNAIKLLETVRLLSQDSEVWNKCQNLLSNLTLEASAKTSILKKSLPASNSFVLWAYFSTNTKGGSEGVKKWETEFNDILTLVNEGKNRYKDEKDKFFIFLNLVIRHFVGGRFTTISSNKYPELYSSTLNFENISQLDAFILKIDSESFKGILATPTSKNSPMVYHLFNHLLNKDVSFNELSSYSDIYGKLDGIGLKYSRNILMDLRREESEHYIAIDGRIESLLDKGFKPSKDKNTYEQFEKVLIHFLNSDRFKITITYANRPKHLEGKNITLWEVDRLLYTLSGMNAIDWINLK